MDPYEPLGHPPGDPGDPGDNYNYLETQEEHEEDTQTERKKEIRVKGTKNKENDVNAGMHDDDDGDKEEDNADQIQGSKETKKINAQILHYAKQTDRKKETRAKMPNNHNKKEAEEDDNEDDKDDGMQENQNMEECNANWQFHLYNVDMIDYNKQNGTDVEEKLNITDADTREEDYNEDAKDTDAEDEDTEDEDDKEEIEFGGHTDKNEEEGTGEEEEDEDVANIIYEELEEETSSKITHITTGIWEYDDNDTKEKNTEEKDNNLVKTANWLLRTNCKAAGAS